MPSNNIARLNREFQAFHAQQKGKYANYVLTGAQDKLKGLKNILDQHQIEVTALAQNTNVKGIEYSQQKTKSTPFPKGALVISGNGKKPFDSILVWTKNSFFRFFDLWHYLMVLAYAHGLKAVATNQNLNTEVL